MNPVYWALWAIGAGLQFVLVYILLQQRYFRTYPYLFADVLTLLVTGGIDFAFRLLTPTFSSPANVGVAITYYWLNDCIRQFALFLVVISLLFQAIEQGEQGRNLRKWLTVAVLLVAVGSAFVFRKEHMSTWLTQVIRNVSFSVVFLNLVLWAALIRRAKPDRLLLMLVGGIGLQMTGESMGQALRSSPIRHSFHAVVSIGNVILVLSHLLCLAIWIHALRSAQQAQQAALPLTEPPLESTLKNGYGPAL